MPNAILLLRLRAGDTTRMTEVSMPSESLAAGSYQAVTRDGVSTVPGPLLLEHLLAPIHDVDEASPADVIVIGSSGGTAHVCVTASRRGGIWRDLTDAGSSPTLDWIDVRCAVLASLVSLTRISAAEIQAEVCAA